MATVKKRSKKTTSVSSKAARQTARSTAKKTASKAGASAGKKSTRAKPGAQKTSTKAGTKSTRAAKAAAAPKASKTKSAKSKSAKSKASTARTSASKSARASAKPAKVAKKAASKGSKAAAKAASAKEAKKAAAKASKTATRSKAGKKTSKGRKGASKARPSYGDAGLFAPLSQGERAQALRILTEDQRLAMMAAVGRYRVISAEPMVTKPPHELADHRLARVVVYDYAAERSVDACIDLDTNAVSTLHIANTQPLLAPEEEAAAIAIALADEQVKSELSLGDQAQAAMYYWSHRNLSLAHSRRSAAVLFGQPHSSPSLVAVVDLMDNLVCEIVPAGEW